MVYDLRVYIRIILTWLSDLHGNLKVMHAWHFVFVVGRIRTAGRQKL
jgi:hypothetical protein